MLTCYFMIGVGFFLGISIAKVQEIESALNRKDYASVGKDAAINVLLWPVRLGVLISKHYGR